MKLAKVSVLVIGALCLAILGASIALGEPAKDVPGKKADSTGVGKATGKEKMVIEWPKSGNWATGEMFAGPPVTQFFYPKGQSAVEWTEMGSVEFDGSENTFDLTGRARLLFLGTQKGSPNATWTILTRGYKDEKNQGFPFVFFRMNCPDFISGEPAQVQYWLLMLGKTGMFTVQYSYKGKDIPADKGNAILQAMKDARIEAVK